MKSFFKKLIPFMLCLCLITSLFPALVYASGESYGLSWEFDKESCEKGDIIKADLVLKRLDSSEGFNLYAFSADVGYMPVYLEYQSCSTGNSDFRLSDITKYNSYFDQIRVSYHGEGSYIACENSSVLASFVFKAINNVASTSLNIFLPDVYTAPGVQSSLTVTKGTIEIGEPSAPTYSISFLGGNGSSGTAPVIAAQAEGNQFNLPENTFALAGYAFTGWSDGNKTYSAGDSYTMPAKVVTFTAQWKKNVFTVSFSGGSGTTGSAPDAMERTVGTKIALPTEATLKKEGYSFNGWSYNGTTYQPGDIFTVPENDVSFAADWTKDETGGGSTGGDTGGSGGGGGGSSSAVTTTAVTIPVYGDEKTSHVSVEISGTEAVLKNEIQKINAVTDKNVQTGTVTVDLSGVDMDITSLLIPNAVFKSVSSAVNDSANDADGMEIKLTDGDVKFDGAALASILNQCGSSNLRLVVNEIAKSELQSVQIKAVEEDNVLAVYDIYMTADGKRISDFTGGSAEITIRHKLTSGQKTDNLEVLYVADNGSKTSIPFTVEGDEVVFTVTHFSHYVISYKDGNETGGYKACPRDASCVITKFVDCDPKEWYHDGLHFCIERGYMNGEAADIFNPYNSLSRAMIVTILWRVEGSPESDYAMNFPDVPENEWYTKAVRWAQSTGVVLGHDDGTFAPEDDVTREQLAAILMRCASMKNIDVSARADLSKYEDANLISDWATDNIRWANAVGIINGRTETELAPLGSAERCEAAAMVQRFCETVLKMK